MTDSQMTFSTNFFPPDPRSRLRSWIFSTATVILYRAMEPTQFTRIAPMPPKPNHWWP